MADESTTTTVTESVPADDVPMWVQESPRATRFAYELSWRTRGRYTVPKRWLRFDATTVPAGNKTEGAAATRVAMAMSENSATPLVVAMEIAITDEAENASEVDLPVVLVDEAMDAMEDRRDSDIHAVGASATSTSGAFTDTLEEDEALDGINTFIALETAKGMVPAVVLGHSSAATFRKSVLQSGAAKEVKNNLFEGVAGAAALGFWGGADWFESGNVSTESGGNNNYITVPGERRSGVGVVEAEGLYAESNRSAEGAREKETYVVFGMGYGVGVTHASKITELRSL